MRLIIIGSMASGKSTVGRKLSKKLGLEFFDTDNEIENKPEQKYLGFLMSKVRRNLETGSTRLLVISLIKKIV